MPGGVQLRTAKVDKFNCRRTRASWAKPMPDSNSGRLKASENTLPVFFPRVFVAAKFLDHFDRILGAAEA